MHPPTLSMRVLPVSTDPQTDSLASLAPPPPSPSSHVHAPSSRSSASASPPRTPFISPACRTPPPSTRARTQQDYAPSECGSDGCDIGTHRLDEPGKRREGDLERRLEVDHGAEEEELPLSMEPHSPSSTEPHSPRLQALTGPPSPRLSAEVPPTSPQVESSPSSPSLQASLSSTSPQPTSSPFSSSQNPALQAPPTSSKAPPLSAAPMPLSSSSLLPLRTPSPLALHPPPPLALLQPPARVYEVSGHSHLRPIDSARACQSERGARARESQASGDVLPPLPTAVSPSRRPPC
ncbi:uncharacterized protein SCHCODRAFT_02686334 [Schizophyllum commune H4-8]|uniref:uncharacterized protein n=1 Tax=Schizophyllum commune (strain H4-8 / FGSC 9210) TaxID=578458 RepID=UPI0021600548|nr:uncharacterized protein SCHCODRAFT_02686334 [Schizophyllum commune H4-8]KAI5894797.1 hypothetical protein SCHCODRAFT_02686334 [Schizophyllum commune H4-8]